MFGPVVRAGTGAAQPRNQRSRRRRKFLSRRRHPSFRAACVACCGTSSAAAPQRLPPACSAAVLECGSEQASARPDPSAEGLRRPGCRLRRRCRQLTGPLGDVTEMGESRVALAPDAYLNVILTCTHVRVPVEEEGLGLSPTTSPSAFLLFSQQPVRPVPWGAEDASKRVVPG